MMKCKCGGEFKNIDPIFPTKLRNQGHVVYDQTRLKPNHATRRCNKCGKLRVQKLRVAGESKHAN